MGGNNIKTFVYFSYGGMLAAYMRFKYPNIIDGCLASSAPIHMQDINSPRDFFFQHVTQVVEIQTDITEFVIY